MPNPLVTFLSSFHKITSAEDAIISAATEPRKYKENDFLFKGGKVCRELFFVCNGVLQIMSLNEKGKEVIHFFVAENRFCSILNSFINQVPAEDNILAACDTEVLAISYARLTSLYAQIPYLEPLITQIIQQALLEKIAVKNSYLGLDSTAKYKTFVMEQPGILNRVALTHVAAYLGITPQSLSRIRKSKK